ncbi:SoxR reducing system RseC family protein [Balneatrix alpica]|uniref:SoxR reducing system RseC family protein n=1 Tax=Balneatrix alpica TaxID=75684 RepID=A0ABV5ZAR3_9GAMM|nr:SoxR reducing system RseC family protein [Balneatrix alpica]
MNPDSEMDEGQLLELGQVVESQGRQVRVETIRRSACGSCQLRQGCGQGLLNRLGDGKRYRLWLDIPQGMVLRVGDQVRLGLSPHALLQVSALAYLLPLAGLFAGVLATLQLNEAWQLGAGALGLLLGLAGLRYLSRCQSQGLWQPQILEKIKMGTEEHERIHVTFLDGVKQP